MASRILERQRLRLGRSSSLDPPDSPLRRRRQPQWAQSHAPYTSDDDDYDEAPGSQTSRLGENDREALVGGGTRGRSLLKGEGTAMFFKGAGGGRGGVRSLSSPAAVGWNCKDRKTIGSIRSSNSNIVIGPGFGGGVGEGERESGLKHPTGTATGTGTGTGIGTGNGKGNRGKGDEAAAGRRQRVTLPLTAQTCFKEERESFIRDLQVLHRQLEAKDRDRARREREHRAASARARAETRAAQERAEALRRGADDATAARAATEARMEAATEALARQTAAAEVRIKRMG